MDILSDVLNNVRLSGSVLFFAEYREPWCIGCPPSRDIAPMLVQGARELVIFHVVIEGACRVSLPDGTSVALRTGNAVLMAHGDAHVMGGRADSAPVPIVDLLPVPPWATVPFLVHGGEGDVTRILCGFLHCADARLSPFLASLPRALCVTGEEGVHSSLLQVQRLLVEEARQERPGYSCVLSRLTETFFVEALRQHMMAQADGSGSLAALRDPVVGRALALLHTDPRRKWTVDALAHEIGTSRSLLASRFPALMGCPPMRYLTRWRLLTAARRLQEGGETIAAVSEEAGYESEAAFSRAFKRYLGAPPTTWIGAGRD